MELREIKKEVRELPNLQQHVQKFQDSWVKPLRSNTNVHLPFLQKLSPTAKANVNTKLAKISDSLTSLKASQGIHDKLQHYSRYLVDLKLSQIQGNHRKQEVITNQLLNDDFLKINTTIEEINAFSQHVEMVSQQYEEINDLLHQELSLEHALYFMELPHRKYLQELKQTSQKHKQIVRQLGREFVSLAKKSPIPKEYKK